MRELDPKFFDGGNNLKTDVQHVLLRVVEDVLEQLAESDIKVQTVQTVLTGSLAGPDWDEQSDVDLHLIVDLSQFEEPAIMKRVLALFAKNWNANEYDLRGRKLELYFQDKDEPHVSPGVYDIENGVWVKVPKNVSINVSDAVKKAGQRYRAVIVRARDMYRAKTGKWDKEAFLGRVKAFWERIRALRKESIQEEGLGGFWNLVFKQMRRNGALEMLLDLIRDVQDDVYEGIDFTAAHIRMMRDGTGCR